MSRQPSRPTRPASRRERRAQQRLDAPVPRQRAARRPQRPGWQSPVVVVTAAAVLIGAAIIFLARPPATANGDTLVEPPTSYAADLVDGDVLGAASARVVMELYADFQCPACKLFVTNELPSLLNEFVKAGTLRIEARDIDVLDRGSSTESRDLAVGAACAAEQDRYWQFHDLVFWNQGRENKGDHDADFIARIATAAEVDMPAWQSCIGRGDMRSAVETATRVALTAGINSTPTLVINGQTSVGVPDYTKLAALIRQLAAGPSPATSPGVTEGATPAASPAAS